MTRRTKDGLYVRAMVFGTEDGLVSSVGLLSGVASADVSLKSIIVSGLILILVGGFSMGVGSFLSESASKEYEERKIVSIKPRLKAGGVITGFYYVAGLIILLPYLIVPVSQAFWISIVLALVALFALGQVSAMSSGVRPWRTSIRMVFLGGVAIAIGVIVGNSLQSW